MINKSIKYSPKLKALGLLSESGWVVFGFLLKLKLLSFYFLHLSPPNPPKLGKVCSPQATENF